MIPPAIPSVYERAGIRDSRIPRPACEPSPAGTGAVGAGTSTAAHRFRNPHGRPRFRVPERMSFFKTPLGRVALVVLVVLVIALLVVAVSSMSSTSKSPGTADSGAPAPVAATAVAAPARA
jgi:hypothetical protein